MIPSSLTKSFPGRPLCCKKPEVLFLATHPDLVCCPSPEGPLPDVGSMIELYNTATGRRPQHIFGKPDPAVLAPLLARYDKKDMIMVGDRLSTDKKLAENAGIDFALVLSGGHAGRSGQEASQPAVVLEDLGRGFLGRQIAIAQKQILPADGKGRIPSLVPPPCHFFVTGPLASSSARGQLREEEQQKSIISSTTRNGIRCLISSTILILPTPQTT